MARGDGAVTLLAGWSVLGGGAGGTGAGVDQGSVGLQELILLLLGGGRVAGVLVGVVTVARRKVADGRQRRTAVPEHQPATGRGVVDRREAPRRVHVGAAPVGE